MVNLAAARTRVRMAGHVHLGVQTATATSNDPAIEGVRRGEALVRQMKSSWTADSFLNVMFRGLQANNRSALLPPATDPFGRMFRIWDNCASCGFNSLRNTFARRGAINFVSVDACKSLFDANPGLAVTLKLTGQQRQLNILRVFEHRTRTVILHYDERCPGCPATATESWITNVGLNAEVPPILVVAFPDEAIVHTIDQQTPVVLFAECVTVVNIRGKQIKCQLLHVIQKNTGHYRDVGIEVQPADLASFPVVSPWILNDNNRSTVGVQTSPPVLATDGSGFRPAVAIYYCTIVS